MERSSSGLRVIAIIFQVLAWVLLAVGVIATIVLFGATGALRSVSAAWLTSLATMVALLPIIVGILYFLFFFTTSNVINLLLQIEENVLTASQYLTGANEQTKP